MMPRLGPENKTANSRQGPNREGGVEVRTRESLEAVVRGMKEEERCKKRSSF